MAGVWICSLDFCEQLSLPEAGRLGVEGVGWLCFALLCGGE